MTATEGVIKDTAKVRPNPFVATDAEATAVANSLFTLGLIPVGGTCPASADPHVMKPALFQLRRETNRELFFPLDTQAEFEAEGYEPIVIDFIAPVIQDDSGQPTYSGDPSDVPGSIFAGKRMPMGYTWYSEFASLLADELAQKPSAKWYMEASGSVDRH
jgi:hypothetical protein